MIIRLPIDVKSLFYNVCNDNLQGHTATVSTVIKQGKSLNQKLNKIFDIKNKIDIRNKDNLISEFIKNSKTLARILSVNIFNKISVNGELIYEGEKSFCIFTKQETDPSKIQYGRIKMHYPISLKYQDDDINIDNRFIIDKVSEKLYNFAFLVNAFEFNEVTQVLNFDVTILGTNQTPYSKIFINEKGVGNKMVTTFSDEVDSYDIEIISLRRKLDKEINPNNYIDVIKRNKQLAIDYVIQELENKDGISYIKQMIEVYPYSLYDIEYVQDGIKKYYIVEQTSTTLDYFNLSYKKINFLSCFENISKIAFVKNINDKYAVDYYTYEDLSSFNKNFNSLTYTKE